MHPTLDAFDYIARHHRFGADEVRNIAVGTYSVALETEIHTLNRRGDAYFNLSYAIAARCVLGRNDYDSFDEKHFANCAIRELMSKVSLSIDPDIQTRYPAQRGSTVKVELSNGQTIAHTVEYARGEPENPLAPEATKEKLRECANGLAPAEMIEELERVLEAAGGPTTLHKFAAAILPAPAFV